jgi:hypothetical protein
MDSLSLRVDILVLVSDAAPRKSKENGGTARQHFRANAPIIELVEESDTLSAAPASASRPDSRARSLCIAGSSLHQAQAGNNPGGSSP